MKQTGKTHKGRRFRSSQGSLEDDEIILPVECNVRQSSNHDCGDLTNPSKFVTTNTFLSSPKNGAVCTSAKHATETSNIKESKQEFIAFEDHQVHFQWRGLNGTSTFALETNVNYKHDTSCNCQAGKSVVENLRYRESRIRQNTSVLEKVTI